MASVSSAGHSVGPELPLHSCLPKPNLFLPQVWLSPAGLVSHYILPPEHFAIVPSQLPVVSDTPTSPKEKGVFPH